MLAHNVMMTKRLASVRTSSTGAAGLCVWFPAADVCAGASASALEIEIVIPDKTENRAHGIAAARRATNAHNHRFGARRGFEIYRHQLPVARPVRKRC